MFKYELKTNKIGFYDITSQVKDAVKKSGAESGLCYVYCPHTTAGITVNENTDPDVGRDVTTALNEVFPKMPGFRHAEGNSDAHVKCSVCGAGQLLIINEGSPVLGRWQSVFFVEFDPPRNRNFYVKIQEAK